MTPHNGIIQLGTIENTGDNAARMGLLTAKFVYYPDCQQLIVWLPKSEYHKWNYGKYQIVNNSTNKTDEQGTVEQKVNGSIQMLFDTLCFSEGDYTLEIEHPEGGKHVLHFKKFAEDFIPEIPKPVIREKQETDSMWKVYKDGFGNPIPNEDLSLREKANTELAEAFKKVVGNVSKEEFEIGSNIKLNSDIINAALAFSTEWGENFQKPIHERMLEKYPTLSFDTIEILQAYVKKTESHIYALGEQANSGAIKESDIGIKTYQQYPWINEKNLSRLAGIAMYYANR